MRMVEGQETVSFWDVETLTFALEQAPRWLTIDDSTGLMTGTPDAAGKVEVVVCVTLEREVRTLDEGTLKWGHEKVTSLTTERLGCATQPFGIDVFE